MSKRTTKKLVKFCENAEFNMVAEQSDEKSFCSGENSALTNSAESQVIPIEPKKINYIKQSMGSASRKFSEAGLVLSVKRFH